MFIHLKLSYFNNLLLIFVRVLHVVLVSTGQQSESAIHIHIFPSFLDFLPVSVTTEHQEEFPMLCSRFSLVIYFKHTFSSVYISISVPNPSHYHHFPT